ncbi:hypothetical protein IWZ00DRAFT_486142 [Phyllosticta capitalensis]
MDGLDVHIRVNNQRLEEYSDESEEDPPQTITKYVVATSGANFSVALQFDPSFAYMDNDIRCIIFLDGNRVEKSLLKASKRRPSTLQERKARRVCKDGNYFKQSFIFSDLAIDVSGETPGTNQKAIDALGEITVKFHRATIISPGIQPRSKNLIDYGQVLSVAEKAIKGRDVSHQAGLAQAVPISKFKVTKTKNIDPSDRPFAVYKFRYRSAKALKSMGLIPQTPKPIPLEERPIEELTLEETRELLRRQSERSARAGTIKREIKSEIDQLKREPGFQGQWEDGDDLAIIEERPAKRHKDNFGGPIETLDLTGD